MTRVLPDPGPARMRSGPSTVETASRWCGLRPARKRSARSVVGVVVIILDGYSFVLLAYRRCAAPLRGTSEFPGGDPFSATPWGIPAGTFGNERVEVFDSRVEPRSGGRQIVPWRGIQMNQFI